MLIGLANFEKRVNSTATPVSQAITEVEVRLKGNCSRENPIFILQNTYASYNYVIAWGRYYYITNVTYLTNDLIEISCSCDVLATYKNEINNTNAYVLYSGSRYNEQIVDTRLSTTSHLISDSSSGLIFDDMLDNIGCYAINVLSSNGGKGCSTYLMSASEIGDLINYLSISDDLELADQMEQLCGGVSILSILSCSWIPISPSKIGGAVSSNIRIGSVTIDGVTGYLMNDNITTSTTLTIPWRYDDFRRSNSYSSLSMWLPFIGLVSLDIQKYREYDSLTVECCIDFQTSSGLYIVSVGGTRLDVFPCNIGASTPISSGSVNPLGALQSGAEGVSKALSLNIGGAVASAFNTVQESIMPKYSSVGSFSSDALGDLMTSGDIGVIRLIVWSNVITDEPCDLLNIHGRPLYQMAKLSELSGYVQCANASVSAAAYESELNALNGYLNSGIYLE